jgi:hypothetical protein
MSRGRYESLPKSEEETEAFVHSAPKASGDPGELACVHTQHGLLITISVAPTGHSWLSILAWSSTLVSAIATLATAHLLTTTSPAPSAKAPLKRLTPYVNPERLRAVIAAHNATFEPVINAGVAAFTMPRNDPKRAIAEDTSRQVHTRLGDVWPEDRHVLVSEDTCEFCHSFPSLQSALIQHSNRAPIPTPRL